MEIKLDDSELNEECLMNTRRYQMRKSEWILLEVL